MPALANLQGREEIATQLETASASPMGAGNAMNASLQHTAAQASFLRLEVTNETKALRKMIAEL